MKLSDLFLITAVIALAATIMFILASAPKGIFLGLLFSAVFIVAGFARKRFEHEQK